MIRLRCIRTSPDTPSMLRFVADYKGGFTAAPAGRCSGHRAENDYLEEAHHDGFTTSEGEPHSSGQACARFA